MDDNHLRQIAFCSTELKQLFLEHVRTEVSCLPCHTGETIGPGYFGYDQLRRYVAPSRGKAGAGIARIEQSLSIPGCYFKTHAVKRMWDGRGLDLVAFYILRLERFQWNEFDGGLFEK